MRIAILTTVPLAWALMCGSAGAQTGPADASKWLQTMPAGDSRLLAIRDASVTDRAGQTIGSVSDFLVDSSGKIAAVVIDIGGLTHSAESWIAVPFDQLQISETGTANAEDLGRGGDAPKIASAPDLTGGQGGSAAQAVATARQTPRRVVLNVSKEDIQKAPRFRSQP